MLRCDQLTYPFKGVYLYMVLMISLSDLISLFPQLVVCRPASAEFLVKLNHVTTMSLNKHLSTEEFENPHFVKNTPLDLQL